MGASLPQGSRMDFGDKQIGAQKGQSSFGDSVRRTLGGLIPNSRADRSERPEDIPGPSLTARSSEPSAVPEAALSGVDRDGVHDLGEVRKKRGKSSNPNLDALRKSPKEKDQQASGLDALRKKKSA